MTRGFPALAARARPAAFDAGMIDLDLDTVWMADGKRPFPMQSVFKAPLAAAVLAEVDAGRLTLSEPIAIRDVDLSAPFSAINEAWPTPPAGHTLSLPAIDLVALAVEKSDNTAADVIMKRIGGPGAVTAWLRGKGIAGMRIDRYEREIQCEIAGMGPFRPAWKDEAAFIAARDTVPALNRQAAMEAYLDDPRDTTTVQGALDFLQKLSLRQLLSPASTALLIRLMSAAKTGATRFAAGLPAGARLAHKTGTGRTDLGFTPAIGEIGLVTLPAGRRFAAAAFLASSTATPADQDRLFADAARRMAAAMGDGPLPSFTGRG